MRVYLFIALETHNFEEKERAQYDKEIKKLEKELEELKKKGPSEQQLALKRKLDEQLEKKGIQLNY